MPSAWTNRIVSHGTAAPAKLLANPANFRRHPPAQKAAMRAALREVGVVQDVIVNRRTGHLLDGHLRVALAIEDQEPTLPVTYVDLDLDTERKALATFDALAGLATSDPEQVQALLATITTESADLQALLDSLQETVPVEEVAFVVEDRPKCPTCGHKLKAGQVLPPPPEA